MTEVEFHLAMKGNLMPYPPIGKLELYPVAVLLPSGARKQQVSQKLDEMHRELQHIQTALVDIKRAVLMGQSPALASGVMNSRNWMFSLVESHCYLQTLLRPPDSSGASGPFHLEMLIARAAKAGIERAENDRRIGS